jgi:membrane-bound ClpP family serine protease
MNWPIIIVLLVGLALVALEIVALPGAICGICGGAMVIVGIWQSYANYGSLAGNITLIASLLVGLIMLVVLMKSGTWKRFSLNEESNSRVNQIDNTTIKPGAKGKTLSRLAPAGKALFGNEIVEVHSENGFIDEGLDVEVVETEGYRIIVKKLNP